MVRSSHHFVDIFYCIVTRILECEQAHVHNTFSHHDMCLLLSGHDPHVLKQEILRDRGTPMGVFLSGLSSFTTRSSTKEGAEIMVSYLLHCHPEFLESLIRQLVQRIGM